MSHMHPPPHAQALVQSASASETACVRDVLYGPEDDRCSYGDDNLDTPVDVLSYDDLRDVCIAHFGYSQLCQNVFDACVDKDRQFVPALDVPRVPLGTFLMYFTLDGSERDAPTLPKTRAGFLTHVDVERGIVHLHMKPRSWRVKYGPRAWLMQLTPMNRLIRELRSNTFNDDADTDADEHETRDIG